jgi:predicted flavoprotein YhiN
MNQDFDIIIVGGGAAGFLQRLILWRKKSEIVQSERGAEVLQKSAFRWSL